MADPVEVPDMLFRGIPEDATPQEALYMRAQLVIQSAFHTFGDRELMPNAATLDRDELLDVLTFATAMLVASDKRIKTNRDLRNFAEAAGKTILGNAKALRDMGDTAVDQLVEAMGMWSSEPN